MATVIAAGVITLTCEVAVLLVSVAAEGSGVLLAALVVSVTVPVAIGVKVVVQLITALSASVVGDGVQTLLTPVAPAGMPVTAQVAPLAVSGPKLVQLVKTVTGLPSVTVCVVAPVALMSA